MSSLDKYQTPLASRYASDEMMKTFSARSRAETWRMLWTWLAEAEKEIGVEQITDEAIAQMKAHLAMTDEAFEVARIEERRRRHDVMAHVYAFGHDAPAAAGIIHLGATSCFVTDNADLIFIRDALDLVLPKLANVINFFKDFALKYKDMPTLGYTHYQPAQLISVGKRAAQWVQELVMDLEDIEAVRAGLKFRGAMGTTGTQASFMEIFHGDGAKIDSLNEILCKKAGFPACYDISTQTYTRKVDLRVANALSAFGATCHRIALDIRHLAHEKEIEEPFEKDQIGSSAMAYKRNPMRAERITSLSRALANLNTSFSDTFANQWLERTLDDSAIRRKDIPEMFLLTDALLILMGNVANGLVVYPNVIRAHVMQELPFMATENVIMKLASKGVSRQDAHEEIRVLSHQAGAVVKEQGGQNDLIQRIKNTEFFKPVHDEIDSMLDPALYIGRCPDIVDKYCGPGGAVEKAIAKYHKYIQETETAQLTV